MGNVPNISGICKMAGISGKCLNCIYLFPFEFPENSLLGHYLYSNGPDSEYDYKCHETGALVKLGFIKSKESFISIWEK